MALATPDERARHAELRKAPIVLEADESIVLRALEALLMASQTERSNRILPGTLRSFVRAIYRCIGRRTL